MKFLIISDLNNIKNKKVTHFSLDKGLNLGKGLKNNGQNVDYIINSDNFEENGINYLNYKNYFIIKLI